MPDLSQLVSDWVGPLLARTPEPRTPEGALRSEVRQRIVHIVETERGVPLSVLRQRIGLGWGALYHQLRRLEESGLVTILQVGRRRFVVRAAARGADPVLAARAQLQGATARRIAELVASGAARNVSDIEAATGLSPRTIRYHLRALLDAGLVTSISRSRHYGLRATPLLLAALGLGDASPPPPASESS